MSSSVEQPGPHERQPAPREAERTPHPAADRGDRATSRPNAGLGSGSASQNGALGRGTSGGRARRKTPAERRAEISSAARELALAEGLTAVTLRAVATRAGVTPALVAHYRPNMDVLVAETFAEIVSSELREVASVADLRSSGTDTGVPGSKAGAGRAGAARTGVGAGAGAGADAAVGSGADGAGEVHADGAGAAGADGAGEVHADGAGAAGADGAGEIGAVGGGAAGAASAADMSATARLGALVATLLDGSRDDVTLVWVEAWALGRRNEALAAAVREQMDAWQEVLRSLIARGAADGEFDVDDPSAVAWQLLGMIDGLNAQALVRWGEGRSVLIAHALEGMLGLPRGALGAHS